MFSVTAPADDSQGWLTFIACLVGTGLCCKGLQHLCPACHPLPLQLPFISLQDVLRPPAKSEPHPLLLLFIWERTMGEGLRGEREGLKMCRSPEHWGRGAGALIAL